ncbi:MAG: esterase-like activity of phytase family protein [Planctomycetia bacterium]|nr:esterase-like activity of phytase family protein [Planctomycetia bacterium]
MRPSHTLTSLAVTSLVCCGLLASPFASRPAAVADKMPQYRVHARGTFTLPETVADADGNGVRLTGVSGVTWLGDDRYAAILDNSHWLARFRLTLAADGAVRGIEDLRLVRLKEPHDYEDVAPCPDSLSRRIVAHRLRRGAADPGPCLLVCEEDTPAVRAVALESGDLVGVVPIPESLRSRRPNRGLEALTVDSDGGHVWTANEEALPADGPPPTEAAGTVVRLARIPIPTGDSEAKSETREFAYPIDPPHPFVRVLKGEPLSGVAALVSLGDDRLLVLERSGGPGLPPFENRIHLVDCSQATDVSGVDRDLAGRAADLLTKRLLWKDSLGCNVEGLCLGPTLANGRRALIAIADNGGLGAPTEIVAFALEGPPPARPTSP